jgi:hypothetical protein
MIGKRLAAVEVCQRACVRLGESEGGRKKGLLIRPRNMLYPHITPTTVGKEAAALAQLRSYVAWRCLLSSSSSSPPSPPAMPRY